MACESEGAGGGGESNSGSGVARLARSQACLDSRGEPAGRGEDLKGSESWPVVSARQQGKAGRAERRGCAIAGVGFGALWSSRFLLAGVRRFGRGWRSREGLLLLSLTDAVCPRPEPVPPVRS